MSTKTVAPYDLMARAERRYLEESKTAAAYWQQGLPEALLASLDEVANRIENFGYLIQVVHGALPATTDEDPAKAVLGAMSDMADRCYEHANQLGGMVVHLLRVAQRDGRPLVQTDKK